MSVFQRVIFLMSIAIWMSDKLFPSFMAYLIHYFYNSKAKPDHQIPTAFLKLA